MASCLPSSVKPIAFVDGIQNISTSSYISLVRLVPITYYIEYTQFSIIVQTRGVNSTVEMHMTKQVGTLGWMLMPSVCLNTKCSLVSLFPRIHYNFLVLSNKQPCALIGMIQPSADPPPVDSVLPYLMTALPGDEDSGAENSAIKMILQLLKCLNPPVQLHQLYHKQGESLAQVNVGCSPETMVLIVVIRNVAKPAGLAGQQRSSSSGYRGFWNAHKQR